MLEFICPMSLIRARVPLNFQKGTLNRFIKVSGYQELSRSHFGSRKIRTMRTATIYFRNREVVLVQGKLLRSHYWIIIGLIDLTQYEILYVRDSHFLESFGWYEQDPGILFLDSNSFKSIFSSIIQSFYEGFPNHTTPLRINVLKKSFCHLLIKSVEHYFVGRNSYVYTALFSMNAKDRLFGFADA